MAENLLDLDLASTCSPFFFIATSKKSQVEKSAGDSIEDGQIGLLKGAGRIHTAIALVIFLWRRGEKVSWFEVF